MSSPMLRSCLLLLVIAVAGCSTEEPGPAPEEPTKCDPSRPAPSSVPAFELLREESGGGYAPLVAGDALVRHHGAQGGSHFYVYGRLFSAEPSVWLLSASFTGADSTLLAQGSRGFTACAAEWVEPREITVFLEASGDLAGTLLVTAKPEQRTPLTFEAPITVGGG